MLPASPAGAQTFLRRRLRRLLLAVCLLAVHGCSGSIQSAAGQGQLPIGTSVKGRVHAGSPRWLDIPAALYTFRGERESRWVAEVSGEGDVVPMLGIRHGARVIASSVRPGGSDVARLEVLLPEDGEYTLAVHTKGMKFTDFTLRLQRDRDLPTSRAGDFVLAHADKMHMWLVDRTTLQRKGDVASFAFTEVLAGSYRYKDQRLHSVRMAYEVNCAEQTFRATKSTIRVLGEDGLHKLVEAEPAEAIRVWSPLEHKNHLQPVVCTSGPLPNLRWPDLDMAVEAFESALRRDEAEREGGPNHEALAVVAEPIALGQTVRGTLPKWRSRFSTNWDLRAYRFPVRAGERFTVEIAAKFRPYVRLRAGDTYLESTFDAMASGVAAPLGEELEAEEDAEVVVEISSFEPHLNMPYDLTVRRLAVDAPTGE